PLDVEEIDDEGPRRSAVSPVPHDDPPATRPRRSAFTPAEPDDEPAPERYGRLPDRDDLSHGATRFDAEATRAGGWSPARRFGENAVAARAIQPLLPDLGATPESPASAPEAPETSAGSAATLPMSPPSPSVQPPLPALSAPVEAEFANTELLPTAARAWPGEEPRADADADPQDSAVEGLDAGGDPEDWPDTDAEADPEDSSAEERPADEAAREDSRVEEPDVDAEADPEDSPPSDVPPPPASTDRLDAPVTVRRSTAEAAAHAAQVAAVPGIAEVASHVAETQELLAQEEAMVSEGGHPMDSSFVGDDTATWLFGSALTGDDHSLYRRPGPGEPETQVDLTPIVIDDPEYDVRKGASPRPKALPRPARTHRAPARRGRSARRVQAAWRDHRRLLTISAIVMALLLVVGVGGYLFSRYDPTVTNITQGPLTLPPTAGDFARDPAQGASPSVDAGSKIQTVSATYSLNGTQEFVAIAYRPQTDPSAALEEIQARNITKVNGGACGRATDQSRTACAVVSGTTAVLLMTLVDQSPDELISAAQSVAGGIGKT
ncbi:MAG TPA: hypothetical protein VFK68_07320, partial [Propionibacteriaceae bacterium]|nr:hypothetical protein [Propionibacteriaceae bacterium]